MVICYKNKWLARYKGKYVGIFNTELEANEAVQNYILNLKTQI